MITNEFFKDYYQKYNNLLVNDELEKNLLDFQNLSKKIKNDNAKLIFCGNGASASISAHGAVDFSKQAKIRSVTFNEANLITCLANDYGYENWFSEALKIYAGKDDAVVLTSVSGESLNLVMGAEMAREMGLKVVTFTGREKTNSLSKLSDINFWVNSHAYNIVECIHMIWLTSVIDSIIGSDTYEVS